MRFFSSPVRRLVRHRGQPPAGRQLVHRPNHVLGVDNQHGRAVLHERAGGNVLDLAELRVERLHDQFALAEKAVDDETVRMVLVADDDDRQFVPGHGRRVDRQHLTPRDETDVPAVELEMLAALEPLDLVLRQLERADDVGERKGVGLAGDLHEQRADDGDRDRQLQLKTRALARLGRSRERCHAPA